MGEVIGCSYVDEEGCHPGQGECRTIIFSTGQIITGQFGTGQTKTPDN